MIETLLALALSLLIAAQDPKVTPELRQHAIEVATFAIQYAENPVNTTQVVETAVGGTEITVPMVTPQIVATSSKLKIESNTNFEFTGGNCVTIPFTLTSDSAVSFVNPETGATETKQSPATFLYRPQSTSTKQTLLFTSGEDRVFTEITLGQSALEKATVGRSVEEAQAHLMKDAIRTDKYTGKCI